MNSTELHLHTYYSLLDGLNSPKEYFQRASELGMTHLAFTDHGNMSAHREAQKEAKNFGIKPILGCEMYISPTTRIDRRAVSKRDDNTQNYNHITVLAKDKTGYENLNKLSEIAWTEGYYYKPRIDMEVLEQYNEGLIVLTGCVNGLIAKAIEKEMPHETNRLASEFKRIFGERVFMEIQGHNEKAVNLALLDVGKKHGIEPVVTSDCHYARKEDLWVEEAMLILSTKPAKNNKFEYSKSEKMGMLERYNYLYPDRKITFEKYEIYLRSAVEHKELLSAQGIDTRPIENTMVVANMIEDYPFYENEDLLPIIVDDPFGELTNMAWKGFKERGLSGAEAEERIKLELKIIGAKGFAPYILSIADVVQWAKSQGIFVGPGRGSGTGSLLLYCLHVHDVNPLKYNLLFFRFINPERNDYPDVDVDFEDKRRSEVKDYVLRKYKHVASIATFGRFQGKESVRSASRVLGVPLGDVNKALKGATYPTNLDFFELWLPTEKGREFAKRYPEAIKLAKSLYKRIRTQGMHAGGIVLSKEPIGKYAPIQTAVDNSDEAGTRIPLVAYDMETVADIGLIKDDFLGLKSLSILSDTLKSIKERHGIDINLLESTYDDPNVYRHLAEGHTQGVFQAEGHTFTHWLLQAGASEFNDLVIGTSIARPGPLTTVGESYKKRLSKEEPITYSHEVMRKHTEETLGLIVYQEQVMLAMTDLADMSMATADKIRKIIGKKRDAKEFDQYKAEFIDGASQKVNRRVAEKLWSDFEAHAGYSFNKSHAVAYSMVTYWTAWLKEHYAIEFMCAALANEDDKDKRLDYLMEAKRLGLRIVLPHVNESGINFEIKTDSEGDYIIFGLKNIKSIQSKTAARIMTARPFKSYKDLVEKSAVKGSGINKTAVNSMKIIGAATFPDNPRTGDERQHYYEYLNIPAFQSSDLPAKLKAQLRDLDEYSETETFVSMGMVREIRRGPGWALVDIVDETASTGVFTTQHTPIETGIMYVFLIANKRIARYVSFNDIAEGNGGNFQFFLERESFPDVPEGMLKVVSFLSRETKAKNKMADVVFTDEHKNLTSAMVFPQMFMAAYSKLKEGAVVDVVLAKTKDGDSYFVDRIL